jgi:hypothetical protein
MGRLAKTDALDAQVLARWSAAVVRVGPLQGGVPGKRAASATMLPAGGATGPPVSAAQGHTVKRPASHLLRPAAAAQGPAGGERHERVGGRGVRPADRHGTQPAGAVPDVDALPAPVVSVAQQLKGLAAQRVEGVRNANPSRTVGTGGS